MRLYRRAHYLGNHGPKKRGIKKRPFEAECLDPPREKSNSLDERRS